MTPSYSVPVLPVFQTQEQQDVLENLKHELATSRQELQVLHSSLETSAQVSHSLTPSLDASVPPMSPLATVVIHTYSLSQ